MIHRKHRSAFIRLLPRPFFGFSIAVLVAGLLLSSAGIMATTPAFAGDPPPVPEDIKLDPLVDAVETSVYFDWGTADYLHYRWKKILEDVSQAEEYYRPVSSDEGFGTSRYTVEHLDSNKIYQFSFKTRNEYGSSEWSPWKRVTTYSGVPSAPQLTSQTTDVGSMKVSWSEPAGNGSSLKGYDLEWREDPKWTDVTGWTNPIGSGWWGPYNNAYILNSWGDDEYAEAYIVDGGFKTRVYFFDDDSSVVSPFLHTRLEDAKRWAENVIFDHDAGWAYSADIGSGWWGPYNDAYILNSWGDDRYAEVYIGNGKFKTKVYFFDDDSSVVSPFAYTRLEDAQRWAESVISDYYAGRQTARFGQAKLNGTSYKITGLGSGARYSVRVGARGSYDSSNGGAVSTIGDWSVPKEAATPKVVPDAPGAPTLVPRGESIRVSWSPAADNGSKVLGYTILAKKTSQEWADAKTWSLDSVEYYDLGKGLSAQGVVPLTEYQVQIQAHNAYGDGPFSPVSTTTTLSGVPDKPKPPVLTPSRESMVVQWGCPATGEPTWDCPSLNGGGSPVEIRYKKYGSNWDSGNSLRVVVGNFRWTISDLERFQKYAVQVRYVGNYGKSEWSDRAFVTTLDGIPDPPGSIELEPYHLSGIKVYWASSEEHGAPVNFYELQSKTVNQSWDDAVTYQVTEMLNGTWTGWPNPLLYGEEYMFRLRAQSDYGYSDWSETHTATTNSGIPDAPDAPVLETPAVDQIDVTWQQPNLNDGGYYNTSPKFFSGSTIQWKTDDGSWDLASEMQLTEGTTTSLQGLTRNTTYQVRVRASTTIGDGPWSEVSTLSTLSGIPGKMDPPSVTASGSPGESSVGWTALPELNGTLLEDLGFDIRWTDVEGEWDPVKVYPLPYLPDRSWTLVPLPAEPFGGPLLPNTTYWWQIRAVNVLVPGTDPYYPHWGGVSAEGEWSDSTIHVTPSW